MNPLRADHPSRLLAAFFVLGAVVSTAQADPIGASYNVTDLGSGTITFSTSNGNTVAVSPTGGSYPIDFTVPNVGQFTTVSNGAATYPFSITPATPLTPNQGIMSNFPVVEAVPPAAGEGLNNPNTTYNSVMSAWMNSNGMVVAIESSGVFGHLGSATAYYAQHNPDGSWGSAGALWRGTGQSSGMPSTAGLSVAGMNNLNQVVGTMGYGTLYQAAVLYDIGTHTLTNLSDLTSGPLSGYVYTSIQPIAIDNLGRILVKASPDGGSSVVGVQTLLLTPAGMPGNPVPAPEPGSLAVMALAVAAFAMHRIRERRRRG